MTGFSPALLRMWERRFEFLSPRRGSGRMRVYGEDDVRVLARVRDLRAQGRTIGEIATIGRRGLLADAPTLGVILGDEAQPVRAEPRAEAPVTSLVAYEMSGADAVLALDGRLRILHASAEVERLLGWFPIELSEVPLASLIARGWNDQRLLTSNDPRQPPPLFGRTLHVPMLHRNRSEVLVEVTFLFARAAADGPLTIATLRPARPWSNAPSASHHTSVATVRRLIERLDLDSVFASVLDTLIEDEHAVRAELWLSEGGRRGLQLRASSGLARPARSLALFDEPLRLGRTIRYDRLARRRTLDPRWIQRSKIGALVVSPIVIEGASVGVLAAFARSAQVPQASTVDALAALAAAGLSSRR